MNGQSVRSGGVVDSIAETQLHSLTGTVAM